MRLRDALDEAVREARAAPGKAPLRLQYQVCRPVGRPAGNASVVAGAALVKRTTWGQHGCRAGAAGTAGGRCPQMLAAWWVWTRQVASSISRPPCPYSTWKPDGVWA